MAIAKVVYKENASATPEVWMDTTQKTVTAGTMLSGTTALKNDGTGITGNIASKSSSDLTASGATVTAPAGYYASSASKSVASGTAGTPTATKGTVSNHSISVTPSVTNTTGYITGSTISGTAVTVNVTELESGTKSITENGTGISVSGYSAVDVDVAGQVPSGIKYSWESWDGGAIDVSGYEYCVVNGMPVKDGHFRAWVDLSDITSSVTATVTIRFNRTQGTVKINWGDGSSDETLSSSSFTAYKDHSYTTAGKYVLDIEFVSGKVGIYSIATILNDIVYIEDACLNDTTANGMPQDSTKLKTIFQDASCTKVGILKGCTNLELVVLSPNLTSIPTNFISDCTNIKKITIPSAVTNIYGSSFVRCSSLLEIHFLPTVPPTLNGSDWFRDINSSCVFYVPSASLTDYQSATNWSTYASRMVGE